MGYQRQWDDPVTKEGAVKEKCGFKETWTIFWPVICDD